jgi:hypothetical protein
MPVEVRFHSDETDGVTFLADDARIEGDQVFVRRGLEWFPAAKRNGGGPWILAPGRLGAGSSWAHFSYSELPKAKAAALPDWASAAGLNAFGASTSSAPGRRWDEIVGADDKDDGGWSPNFGGSDTTAKVQSGSRPSPSGRARPLPYTTGRPTTPLSPLQKRLMTGALLDVVILGAIGGGNADAISNFLMKPAGLLILGAILLSAAAWPRLWPVVGHLWRQVRVWARAAS